MKKTNEDAKKKDGNMHEGHRARLRAAVENDPDMATFSEYQTLELILSYLIPRRDTNPIAHELIQEFGTLYNVFQASKEELFAIKGMTNTAASFISSFYSIMRKSEASRLKSNGKLTMVKDVVKLLGPNFIGRDEERVYCITLDLNDNIKNVTLIGDGSVDSVSLNNNKILVLVTRFKAKKVIIAHNHPAGAMCPSLQDIEATRSLFVLLAGANAILSDHIIFNNDGEYYSFFEHGLLDDLSIEIMGGNKKIEDKAKELRSKRAAGIYIFEPKAKDPDYDAYKNYINDEVAEQEDSTNISERENKQE